jgi:hypothetical protein
VLRAAYLDLDGLLGRDASLLRDADAIVLAGRAPVRIISLDRFVLTAAPFTLALPVVLPAPQGLG